MYSSNAFLNIIYNISIHCSVGGIDNLGYQSSDSDSVSSSTLGQREISDQAEVKQRFETVNEEQVGNCLQIYIQQDLTQLSIS